MATTITVTTTGNEVGVETQTLTYDAEGVFLYSGITTDSVPRDSSQTFDFGAHQQVTITEYPNEE